MSLGNTIVMTPEQFYEKFNHYPTKDHYDSIFEIPITTKMEQMQE